MLNIRDVLFPTDFSEHAGRALPHALALARRFDARIHMLHAVVLHAADPNEPDHRFPDLDEAWKKLDAWAEERLEAGIGEEDRVEVVRERVRGISAAPVIVDYAVEGGVDLVVMGTHGRRGLRHMMLGSVAEEVVRTAPCPVLTVRGEGPRGPAAGLDRVLVPVDMSEHSFRALEVARKLAAAWGGAVEVLHVVEDPTRPDIYGGPPTGPRVDHGRVRETLVARLGGGEEEVPVEVHVDVGQAVSTVAEFAETEEVDVIVLASHGLTGIKRALLGSVAERVIRQAPCPVLTVRADGRDLLSGEEDGDE